MEYTKLEYIELTGTQYINTTEQIWNTSKYSSWKIEFDFEPTATYNYNAIFGTASGATTFESWIASDNNFYFRYNNNKQTVAGITVNTRYKFIADYTPSTLTFTINDTSRSISQSAGNIASDLYVGHRDTNYGKFKIYSLKLYGSGSLVRDFIPCEYEGAIGLWDKVSNQFYPNSGTGAFEAKYLPEPYTQLKYIDFTPTTYIDTNTYPNASTYGQVNIDLSFSMNSLGTESILFTTATAGYNNSYKSIVNASSVLQTVYGYSSYKQTVGALELNRVYSYQMTREGNNIKPILDGVQKANNIVESDGNSTSLLLGQGNFRCYSFNITIKNELLRSYIPVIKTSDSKPYMFDILHNQFYGNEGTGEFIPGPVVGPKTLKVKMVDKNDLYTKLDYIQSTGTQYIDTGVKFTTGFACQIKFNMLSTSGDIDILSSAQNDNYLLVSYLNGAPRIYLNSSSSSRNITMPYNTIHTVNMNYNGSTLTYTVDNTTTYTISKSNATANSNLLLFARSATYGFSKAVLYYCKIWNGDTLVKDLIPVKKASDNTVCLYDLVSNTFLENGGSGEFVAGSFSLASKTVSNINGKYVKTINGISVQCWKKKEIDINFGDFAQFYEDDLSILTGIHSNDVAIGNINIDDYNTYSKNLQSGVFAANVDEEYVISPTELYEKIAGSVPSQIKTNYGNEIDLSNFDILLPFVKCVGTVSGTSEVKFSVSSPVLTESAQEDMLIMAVNTIDNSIVICELDDYSAKTGNIQSTFNQWENTIFLILQRVENPETWKMNETLTGDYNFNVNVNFIADGTGFSNITVQTDDDGIVVMYGEDIVYNAAGSGVWEYDNYRTIEFYDEVTDENLLTWLQENGVKQ